jgi:hypothetical protein
MQSVQAIPGTANAEAGSLKGILNHLGNLIVVFDHEDRSLASHPTLLRALHRWGGAHSPHRYFALDQSASPDLNRP